jgi:hypothetical protein
MLHIYVLLLNIILDKGIISESWGKGILIPIFKNKGSKSNSNSYRRVTLNSCINKNGNIFMSQCGDLGMLAHKKKMKFISNMNLTKTTYSFMLRYICPFSSFNGEFLIKMFSAVLNNRLTKYSDEFELITNAPVGFRKGFSTNDNIFILHALISI